MKYDFTTILNRFGVGSNKWDDMIPYGITPESKIVPMSNAEMEFPNAPEIIEGLQEYVGKTVMAYYNTTPAYNASVVGWMKRRHNWDIEADWIVPYPGVHGALCMMLQGYAEKGDGVIVLPPTWPGFFDVIENNGQVQVDVPLLETGDGWQIDFDGLEKACSDPQNKFLFFCSPANPVGRVWTRDELIRVAEICLQNNVLLVADELHSDLIMPGYTHVPLAAIDPARYNDNLIICTAPSKTFNLAGLATSNIIIPNKDLRDRFIAQKRKCAIFRPDMLGMAACSVAYDRGADWLDACIEVLNTNANLVYDYLRENLPMLKVSRLEGTYLMWLDLRPLGIENKELERALMEDAKVFIDDGYYFGVGGDGFERVNIAVPTEVLLHALERLKAWIGSLGK